MDNPNFAWATVKEGEVNQFDIFQLSKDGHIWTKGSRQVGWRIQLCHMEGQNPVTIG